MSEKRTARKTSSPATTTTGSPMDVGLLEQLVKLMASNDLNTVAIKDGDRRIVLKRGPQQFAGPVYQAAPMMAAAPPSAPPQAAAQPSADAGRPTAAAGGGDEAGLHAIKSPMVGTFYSAASPEAKPFVQVGSTVDEDTDVCIIEAMKVFNNIKAETRGTIAKVLVTNGQTVEFGQPLFLVKP